MGIIITVLQKLGNFLRAFIRILRKAICCRRRQNDAEMLLPLTVPSGSSDSGTNELKTEYSDFHNWDSWDENTPNSAENTAVAVQIDHNKTLERRSSEADSIEDIFKDMVPQYRKAKKLIVKETEDSSHSASHMGPSSRLSMDPKAFLAPEAELGLLMDNATNWEACENLDESVDPDSVLKEKRLAEREKRLAEHQRRKQEKERRRTSKQNVPSTQSFHPSKDKTKDS